jgi:hypothetical protein
MEGINKIAQKKGYSGIDMYPSYNMRVILRELNKIRERGEGIGGG